MLDVIAPAYREDERLADLRAQIAKAGYVKLPGLLTPHALSVVGSEMAILRRRATRRSFVMPGVLTPRQMSTVGGRQIVQVAPFLADLYWHDQVLAFLRALVKGVISRCQHGQEFMVANFLDRHGDSHGWHLDDPAYAIVVIVEAPVPADGGCLEAIPDWAKLYQQWGHGAHQSVGAVVAKARAEGLVEVRHHAAGDAYFLKASTVLHRVSPIVTQGARRAAINMAYQDAERQEYGESATILYGDSSASDIVPSSEQRV